MVQARCMSLEADLRVAGGITTSRALHELGHSAYDLRKALASGRLTRPRRGWAALPCCDPELRAAASHGVILSCITQARRLGLWVPDEPVQHVAVRTRGDHVSLTRKVVHWSAPLVPRDPTLLGDPIENVLHYASLCQPFEEALTIWESALNKGLIDMERLASLRLRPAARALLAECTPFADSGLETLFRIRLRWLGVGIRHQTWILGHRVDFLIGECLVVQIDGKQHAGAQRSEDNRHDAELRLRGYHVLRCTYAQVMHDWPMVQSLIQESIAAGLHRKKLGGK